MRCQNTQGEIQMDDYLEEIVAAKFDELDYIESFDDYQRHTGDSDWADYLDDGIELDRSFNE